jgi:hypothetical protein
MVTYLLHNPWVRLYLLYVAALLVACLWDYLHNRTASREDSRTPHNEKAHGAPDVLPSAASKNRPRAVSRSGRRTD